MICMHVWYFCVTSEGVYEFDFNSSKGFSHHCLILSPVTRVCVISCYTNGDQLMNYEHTH